MALTLGELSGILSLDDKPFEQGLKSATGKLEAFGGAAKLKAVAAGAAIGVAITAGMIKTLDFEKGNDKLAASLGLTAKDSEKAGKAAGKLYANAYGSSLEEVNGAVEAVMSSIKGMREASSGDIEAMTAKVLDMAAAFEIDAGRAAQVAGQMITSGLATDGVQAADLLTASLQKVPKAVREDLLDAVDEYGPFFKNLGFSGGEAMTMLVDASAKGMYGIDKTGDALKEFGIRATDMSELTGTAYEALGLDQQEMTNQLLAGGDTARSAFDKIIMGLGDIKDPAAQSQAALALFGTPLEDLAVQEIPGFIDALLNSQEALGTVEGSADAMGKTLADNAGTNIETFKRGLETTFVDILGNKVIPFLSEASKWCSQNLAPALDTMGQAAQNSLQWVKENAAWLIPLTAGIVGYVAAVGTMSLLNTVRGWIAAAAAAQWGLNIAMSANPIGLIIAAIAALVAGLIWFFTQTELGKDIIKNVWSFIQTVVNGVVDWFQNTALPIIQEVFKVVGEVFTWLYENIIRPVFEGISTVVNAAWLVIRAIFQVVEAVITKIIGPAFQWLWESIIKPVFGFIGALISFWWNNTVKPIFDGVMWVLNNVLGPAFKWLYETIIKPAFDAIGAVIKWVWEHVIKPVFDTLTNWITKDIPKAFEDGVKFIESVWKGIQDIVKAPIKFVVNTVLNDGLIGAFNTVADFLKIDKLPKIALPPGFAAGGWTGPGGKYQPAGIVHADEHVIRKESRRRMERTNPGLLDHINRTGSISGYAGGGRVSPLKNLVVTQGYNRVHKGIDYAAAEGTPVYATQDGVVSHAGPGASAPGVWGGNEIHILGSGLETWFAHLSRIGVGLGENVRAGQQIGLSGNTGISSGPHLHFGVFQGGWPNDMDPNAYLGGAGTPSGTPSNPITALIDVLIGKFKEAFPQGGAFIDLVGGVGKSILTGAADFITGLFAGSQDKKGNIAGVPTVFDGGGWLENTGGPQLVDHRRSKPDAVLSAEQWADIHKLALSGAKGEITYAPVFQAGPDFLEQERIARARFKDTLSVYA